MRITVCRLSHQPAELESEWSRLCRHTAAQRAELVLLPELAFVEPLWAWDRFDTQRWNHALAACDSWIQRLSELRTRFVVGARPITSENQRYIEGFLWSDASGLTPLRRKFYLPNEPGIWESRWFARGDRQFPRFRVGGLSFGLNVCTELWALDTYANYAEMKINAVLAPRATAAATARKWLAAGTVAAVRSGAYCLSSNRAQESDSGESAGWVIDPDGTLLAETSAAAPFATVNIDLSAADSAPMTYPRNVFGTAPTRARDSITAATAE